MSSSKAIFILFILFLAALLTGQGCGSDTNNKNSLTSGTNTGGGGSGLPPAAITVVAGNSELAAEGITTITVMVTDSRGARTEATFYLTSSRGGNFIIDGATKSGTIVGTTTGGIFITTFEAIGIFVGTADGVPTEIAATIPGTSLRGSTTINIK
jgi:hypothetical protein